MTTIPENLLDAALKLPAEVREDLAARLLDSLEPVDEGAEAEWDEDIKRRQDDLNSGREKAIPLEEAWKIIMDDSGDADDAD